MRFWICLWMVVMFTGSAWAGSAEALSHADRGKKWRVVAQYQKAIEEYEQAYQEDDRPGYLYFIAQNYERLANTPTKTSTEVLAAKQQALAVYESFIEKAQEGESGLDIARHRIEPLRQEIKDLAVQVASKVDKIDQMLAELHAIHELLLRRDCGGHATAVLAP